MLIKGAKIIDKHSPHNGTIKDILIVDGIIQTISDYINSDHHHEIIDAKGNCISRGWFDMKVNFCDPGEEYKEDLLTGCAAAAAGGFTAVALMPSTVPPLQTKSQIEYIVNKTANNTVNVYPIGAVTKNLEGKELCELYDMKCAGAVAFTDDKKTIHDSGLLLRALLYAENIESLIITFAEDNALAMQGQVNESAATTRLGFKGVPSLAEELIVARDIQLSEYADVSIHISCVSSAKSVELIRAAKRKGLRVTCDVAAYSLLNTDNDLITFDSNFKVKPPLRSKADVEALRNAVADNTIDVIVSDHNPQHFESKQVEFDYAAYGMIGLESFFGVVMNSMQNRMDLSSLMEKFTVNPRRILNLPVYELREGEPADFTIFNPNVTWTFGREHIHSKSKNTPYLGINFKGKAEKVINFA